MTGCQSELTPNVLVLTSRFPYPVIGGDRLRIFQICKELSLSCTITLLCMCESIEEMNYPIPDDGVFTKVHRIYLPRWKSLVNALFAIPTKTPLQVAYYYSKHFSKMLKNLLPENHVCLAHLIRTGDYVKYAGTPRILEMTDAISLNYKRVRLLKSQSFSLRSLIFSFESKRLERYERHIINQFDAVSLVSDYDKNFLLCGKNMSNAFVCSNGVDLTEFNYSPSLHPSQFVIFIGNMTSLQNMDACLYFINDILPKLRLQGDFRFRIIGKMNIETIKHFERFPNVEVFANVNNVAQAKGNAFAGVAPVRLGAGVQNKILEYMALGLPTVTSSIGLEGLNAMPGKDILVADEPDLWVSHLLSLWNNTEKALDQAKAGREYVEKCHSWHAQLAPIVEMTHNLSRFRVST